jgi:hypothetical protein
MSGACGREALPTAIGGAWLLTGTTPPAMEGPESWAGGGRILRASGEDLAAWRLLRAAKDALIYSDVPLLDNLVHEVVRRAAPPMHRLALDADRPRAVVTSGSRAGRGDVGPMRGPW